MDKREAVKELYKKAYGNAGYDEIFVYENMSSTFPVTPSPPYPSSATIVYLDKCEGLDSSVRDEITGLGFSLEEVEHIFPISSGWRCYIKWQGQHFSREDLFLDRIKELAELLGYDVRSASKAPYWGIYGGTREEARSQVERFCDEAGLKYNDAYTEEQDSGFVFVVQSWYLSRMFALFSSHFRSVDLYWKKGYLYADVSIVPNVEKCDSEYCYYYKIRVFSDGEKLTEGTIYLPTISTTLLIPNPPSEGSIVFKLVEVEKATESEEVADEIEKTIPAKPTPTQAPTSTPTPPPCSLSVKVEGEEVTETVQYIPVAVEYSNAPADTTLRVISPSYEYVLKKTVSGSGSEIFEAKETGTYFIYLQNESCSVTKELRVKEPPRPPCKDYGDLDDDGYVSMLDFYILGKHLQGVIPLTEEQRERADVNADGVIDEKDAELIKQFIFGEIDTFPVCELVVLAEDSPFFVQVEDPDEVLTEEDEWWYSNRVKGEEYPRLVMRVRGSSLKFKVKRNAWWGIKVEGSGDMKEWSTLYEESGILGPTEKEIEVSIEGYDFIRFTLMDGDASHEWIRLSKKMIVKGKEPLPLCEWLSSTITSMDIAELVLAFNGVVDLGFVVLRKDIEGVAKLYKGEEYECGW